jgi:hypothetical protein
MAADVSSMTGDVLGLIAQNVGDIYPTFTELMPAVVMLVVSIAVYSFLIYNFYKLVAKRDVFEVSMEKYRRKEPGFLSWAVNKVLSVFKYGVIFPFVVFLWFGGFGILLFLLAKNIDTAQILLISATFVASIRLLSYYSEELSRDLAKMIPFALLAVAIIDPSFFSLEIFWERLGTIWLFIPQLIAYSAFVISLEWVLRILLFVKHLVPAGAKEEPAAEA